MVDIFTLNRILSRLLEHHLPQTKPNVLDYYNNQILAFVKNNNLKLVADFGAGQSTDYIKNLPQGLKVIGVDITLDAMKKNNDLSKKLSADLNKKLPLPDNSYNLITLQWTMEHLKKTEEFIAEVNRVLVKDGFFVALFACKFAPFAIISKIIPYKWKAKIMYFLNPEIKDKVGFPAYYNNCYYKQIKLLLTSNNFEIIEIKPFYYQSQYYDFFLPFYLLSVLYELLIYLLGIKNLSAYLVVIAKKK